jgi:hypothetical protein
MPTNIGGPPVKDIAGVTVWQANTMYPANALVLSDKPDPDYDNDYVYQLTGASGLSGNKPPLWTTTLNQETQDDHLVWKCVYLYVVWECFGATGVTFSPRTALGGRLRHNMTANQG